MFSRHLHLFSQEMPFRKGHSQAVALGLGVKEKSGRWQTKKVRTGQVGVLVKPPRNATYGILGDFK